MLRYLGSGVRRFGSRPVWSYRRTNWEFYAVLKGQCGVLLESKPAKPIPLKECRRAALRHSTLWVFPPQHDHGWYGREEASCQVAVFHYNRVPDILEQALRDRDYLEVPLSVENCRKIREMAADLQPEYEKPTSLGSLRAERALIDLTLLSLADAPVAPLVTREHKDAQKVDAALSWFLEHMAERPTLDEIALAVHVSSTKLRRLFGRVREESPYHALNEMRLDAAARLLVETDDKLESIASECGFSSASNFCRSFKDYRGCSPSRWRRRLTGYENSLKGWTGLPET